MKKGSLTSIQEEVLAFVAEKGLPLSPESKEFLISRISSEVQELQVAVHNNESPERIAEEAIDILVQAVQLVLALGVNPDQAYRNKMDKNWSRNWKKNDKGEYRSL